jgi:hypothetical protein
MEADEAVIDRSLPPIRDAKGRWRMHGGQSPALRKAIRTLAGVQSRYHTRGWGSSMSDQEYGLLAGNSSISSFWPGSPLFKSHSR